MNVVEGYNFKILFNLFRTMDTFASYVGLPTHFWHNSS